MSDDPITTEEIMAMIHNLSQQPPLRRPLTDAERKEQRLQERLGRAVQAGIPEVLHPAIKSPQDRPALLAVRKWADSDKKGLLLCGSNQVGKSGAAAAWLSTQERGIWITASEIGLAVQPDPDGKGAAELRRLRGAGALVVDNVGERCGPSGYEHMEALLAYHMAAGRRLILTSDLAPPAVFALFGDGERNRILARWKLYGTIEEVGPWTGNEKGATP